MEDVVTISIRDVGGTKVVEVEGDVNLRTSPAFRRTLFETLAQAARVALNLKAIRYIDSSGIATLIEVLKDSQRLNKEFVLFGLSPAVHEVFRLTHVIRVFQIFQTELEALETA
jgi:anti-sigma B factor antagonist